MIAVAKSTTGVEAVHNEGVAGLVGTIEFKIVDNDGATAFGPTTAGIVEFSPGFYRGEFTAPASAGQYSILWSPDGSFDEDTTSIEDLLVTDDAPATALPPLVPSDPESPDIGPCSAWTTAEDAADCCGESSSDAAEYEDAVTTASQLLYAFSAKQFPGICERTVRPCSSGLECGVQVLSRGHVVTWDGSIWTGPEGAPSCSCSGVSRVLLPNYPVRSIELVLIDGDPLDPGEYRLDGKRYLTRMRDAEGNRQTWPRCQVMDLDSSEEGTFEVTYLFGREVPTMGVQAANQLACQVHLACQPTSNGGDQCILPSGVVRITRQQVSLDFSKFAGWGFSRKEGWRTGMSLVDAFLNAVNPNGLRRPPLIWSPDAAPFAEEVGTVGGS